MPKTKTPRRKRNDGVYEVPVAAKRMGPFEQAEASAAEKMGMSPEQYRQYAQDAAIGFASPIYKAGINLRKLTKTQAIRDRVATGASYIPTGVAAENEGYARGGKIDGVAKRGKTKGRMR
jgi:hypothetical protein